jgi:hypothetical protein
VGGGDIEEDLGLGGEDLDTEVFGAHVEGGVGVVGDADVGAGVDALMGDGHHDGEARRIDDLIAAAVEGLVDTSGAGFAADDVVGEDGFLDIFGDAGSEGEGRRTKSGGEGEFLEERHRGTSCGESSETKLSSYP